AAFSPRAASRCGSADRPSDTETSILHSPDRWVFQKTISRPSSVQAGAWPLRFPSSIRFACPRGWSSSEMANKYRSAKASKTVRRNARFRPPGERDGQLSPLHKELAAEGGDVSLRFSPVSI